MPIGDADESIRNTSSLLLKQLVLELEFTVCLLELLQLLSGRIRSIPADPVNTELPDSTVEPSTTSIQVDQRAKLE